MSKDRKKSNFCHPGNNLTKRCFTSLDLENGNKQYLYDKYFIY